MASDTHKRDEAVRRQRDHDEQLRREMLERVRRELEKIAEVEQLDEALIFGSITKTGHFHTESDVDIAVRVKLKHGPFRLAGTLSSRLGRDVHIIELGDDRISDVARREGVRWTRQIARS
jgi:predicted nucleotidyltransferase